MVEAQVTDSGLAVALTGKDAWLYALRPSWQVAVRLEHVRPAEVGRPVGLFVKRHSGGRGGHGGNMMAARRTGPAVVIHLDGDPYLRMTLSVADPAATVAAISSALRRRRAR